MSTTVSTNMLAGSNEAHEIVLVGFGPSTLSLAIAIYENSPSTKVLILEQKPRFSWTHGLPNDRTRMRNTLIMDLVTPRNPKSEFTFVNYLWNTGTLVSYLNMDLLKPPRNIWSKYLDWCAQKIEALGWVRYESKVVSVQGAVSSRGAISDWRVNYRGFSGQMHSCTGKKIVLASGSNSLAPRTLAVSERPGRVLHSSSFTATLPQLRQFGEGRLRVAIIGANSDAVEILNHCMSLRDAYTTIFTEDSSFSLRDNNPFAGCIIAEDEVLPFELRSHQANNGNPGSAIDGHTLHALYNTHYSQLVKDPNPETHRFRIQPNATITSTSFCSKSNGIILNFKSPQTGKAKTSSPFDYVFAASQERQSPNETLLADINGLFDSTEGFPTVDNEYRVNMKRGATLCGTGMWLMNAFASQETDVFEYAALRADVIRRSMMQICERCTQQGKEHGYTECMTRL